MKKLVSIIVPFLLVVPVLAQEQNAKPATQAEVNAGTVKTKYVSPFTFSQWWQFQTLSNPVLSAVDNGTRTTLLMTNALEAPTNGFIGKLIPNATNYTTFTNVVPFTFLYDYGTAAFYQAASTNARGAASLPAGVALGHGATFNRDSNYVSFVAYLPINADTNFDPVLLLTSPKNGASTGNGVLEVSLFAFRNAVLTTEDTTNYFTNAFSFGAGPRPQTFTMPLTGTASLLTNQGSMLRLTVRRWGDNASDTLTLSNYISGAALEVLQKVP